MAPRPSFLSFFYLLFVTCKEYGDTFINLWQLCDFYLTLIVIVGCVKFRFLFFSFLVCNLLKMF